MLKQLSSTSTFRIRSELVQPRVPLPCSTHLVIWVQHAIPECLLTKIPPKNLLWSLRGKSVAFAS